MDNEKRPETERGQGMKWGTVITGVVIVLMIVAVFLFWQPVSHWFQEILDPVQIQHFLEQTGPLAPLLFVLFQAAQVVIAPIPMQVIGLAGGYLFGTFWGTIYSSIGLAIGSAVAIMLSRIFGRKLVERFVEPQILAKFDYLAERGGLLVFFLIFLLPALPDDAICFIAGLTSIRLSSLVIVAIIGRLPGLFYLTLVGEQFREGLDASTWIIIIGSGAVVIVVILLLKPWVERWFAKPAAKPAADTEPETLQKPEDTAERR